MEITREPIEACSSDTQMPQSLIHNTRIKYLQRYTGVCRTQKNAYWNMPKFQNIFTCDRQMKQVCKCQHAYVWMHKIVTVPIENSREYTKANAHTAIQRQIKLIQSKMQMLHNQPGFTKLIAMIPTLSRPKIGLWLAYKRNRLKEPSPNRISLKVRN